MFINGLWSKTTITLLSTYSYLFLFASNIHSKFDGCLLWQHHRLHVRECCELNSTDGSVLCYSSHPHRATLACKSWTWFHSWSDMWYREPVTKSQQQCSPLPDSMTFGEVGGGHWVDCWYLIKKQRSNWKVQEQHKRH